MAFDRRSQHTATESGRPGGAQSPGPGKRTLTEALPVGPAGGATSGLVSAESSVVQDTAAAGVAGAGGALPHAHQIQSSFGVAHDVSSIRAHVGGNAAAATERMGADAYATGNQVAFRQAPSLHTAAHEAAHVMQQHDGVQLLGGVGKEGDSYEQNADAVADRVVAGQSAADLLPKGRSASGAPAVQMRRLPTNSKELLTDPADAKKKNANYAANAAGTKTLIQRAEAELSAADKAKVTTEMLGGKSQAVFNALPEKDQLERHVNAIEKVRPDLTLGDPKLIDVGPRSATADAANLKKLVANASKVFLAIGGSRNADLEQVFGKANIMLAIIKYMNGYAFMNTLAATDHVVTDRSGYNDEVGLGGLTAPLTQISLQPSCFDQPDDLESIITMIHESMHAGNPDVGDDGTYIGQPGFTEVAEDMKLKNAAHFEITPRRVLGANDSFPGKVFIPKGTSVGGVPAPVATPMEEARTAATNEFRLAWTAALNLHTQFNTVFKDQTQWNADLGGGRKFSTSLPFWSKVENLTVHKKTVIDPASPNAAKQPISQIDMALSEGVVRKFVLAMELVPKTDADGTAFEAAHSTAAERTVAHASVAAHTKFLVKLVLKQAEVAPITGALARDIRVVDFLSTVDLSTMWDTRVPGAFPE
jgi:Domain of unknown function (DUF4157)